MLQQTQVSTVIGYFNRFVTEFPDVDRLAAAPLERVLELWSGLGYYRRAHHLHAAAKVVVASHRSVFPSDAQTIAMLPGIGRSTAAAIATFAYGIRAPILDGNVKRVLARHQGESAGEGQLLLFSASEELVLDKLREVDVDNLTPIAALSLLASFQGRLKNPS